MTTPVSGPVVSGGGSIPEFTSKAARGEETDSTGGLPPYHFILDGVQYTAKRPKDALVAELAPVQSRRTAAGTKVKLALNFLDDCLEEPGRTILSSRLLDRDDPMDVEDVLPILHAIGDHWKAHQAAQRGR